MKQIVLTYNDSEATPNLNVSAVGFTDAEVLVILREAERKVSDSIIEALKKKSSPILVAHAMPINKA